MAQLIELITQMPEADCSHDRGHKHPFTVSEIFNCELGKINDLFFQSRDEVAVEKKEIKSSPLPKDDNTSEEEEDEDEKKSPQKDEDDDEEDDDEVKIITEEDQVEQRDASCSPLSSNCVVEIPQVVIASDEETFEKVEREEGEGLIEVLQEEIKDEVEAPVTANEVVGTEDVTEEPE